MLGLGPERRLRTEAMKYSNTSYSCRVCVHSVSQAADALEVGCIAGTTENRSQTSLHAYHTCPSRSPSLGGSLLGHQLAAIISGFSSL